MKIVFLNDFPFSLGFGGKEIQLQKYFDFLTKNNFKVELLSSWDKDAEYDIAHLFGSTKIIHSYVDILKNRDCRIILSPNFYSATPRLEKVLVTFFRRFPIPNIFSYRFHMFDKVDRLICNSPSERLQLQRIYNVPDDKIFVVRNGTDINDTKECSIDICKQIPSQYILSVGYFDERKRTVDLINAYKSSNYRNQYKLVLVGQARFALTTEKDLFDEISEDPDVYIFNDISPNSQELIELYRNAEAHLLPSVLETPGIANLEAASFRLPLFIGDCPPVRDYFGDEVYYVPSGTKNLTYHLNDFLGNLARYRPSTKDFSWEAAFKELTKIYEF